MAYLSGNDHVMEEGICFLDFESEDTKIGSVELGQFYDTPYREQYHFVPFKNWINDPNGLCWHKGYYHLYFQANPHKQEWNDMYWGHAVSKDLIHWKHLPYVLEPQKSLYGNDLLKGGAFSGSAVVKDDEVLFYLTRHEGPQEDGPQTKEWQTMTRSKDLITFQEEKVIIPEAPDGVGHDFRDPKVSYINGQWYMVLACNYKGDSAMLLYKSADLENWEYIKPIVIDPEKGSTTFECPDFFTLDNKQVAVAALMRHNDEQGRYQMTRYYIGELHGEDFQIENTGWFDFGSNYYAVQSFEHEGRRIAIGWISDFYGEHRQRENGAYGSFAIPRQLRIADNKLYMEPVPEIYSLKHHVMYEGVNDCISLENIEGNSYYVKIELRKSCDFYIELGKDVDKNISLIRKDGITMLKTKGVQSEKIDFVANVDEVEDLEIFVDRRVVEVFINKGEAAGAKLFYTETKDGTLTAKFEQEEAVKYMEVCSMKTIW